MSYYVGNFENAPFVQMPAPEERILRCFISPELDPTNQDIALGMTEMQPGCKSDWRGHAEGERFICVKGKGHVRIEEEIIELKEGSVVYVPKWAKHQLMADCDDIFTVYWVLTPPFGGDKMTIDLARKANADK